MLSRSAISPAANRWQKGLIEAIQTEFCPIVLIAHLPESYWPRGNVRPGRASDIDGQFKNCFVQYLNVPLLRSYTLSQGYSNSISEIEINDKKPLAIISYNPNRHNIAAGLYAQSRYNIPWIDLCADAYEPGEDWIKYPCNAKRASGHVFLSYGAYESCPYSPKLHLDGGVNQIRIDSEKKCKKRADSKIILYSGMMSIWGGVSFLLKAFKTIDDPTVKLWICGHGRNADLESALKYDKRIRNFGFVSENRLQELCQQANVFINPRPANIPGNKMNFPSKILEYLIYGKPIISTWTPGLSPEYREVLEVLDEENIQCLAEKIKEVIIWPEQKVKNHASKVRSFLLTQKTWKYQAQRLADWLENEVVVTI